MPPILEKVVRAYCFQLVFVCVGVGDYWSLLLKLLNDEC